MKKALLALFLSGVLFFGIGITTYFIIISVPSSNSEEVVIIIKYGDDISSVTKQLKDQKLIKSKFIFKAYLVLTNKNDKIQPGEYGFNQVNISKIVSKITQPPEFKPEVSLTFLEGWTSDNMADYLEEKGIVFGNDFLKYVDTTDTRTFIPDTNYEFLSDKPITAGLEGYLFPDTYRVFEDVTASTMVKKMLDNFDVKIYQEFKNEIDSDDLKLYDIITLASIVEKEARTKEDKKTVAGIFKNRLAIDQRLESDATINYVTGKSTTRPSYKDLAIDDLYNTYKYSGLPPGPICNPSKDSIIAVLNPEPSDYLYFLNTPSGNIVFSRTYEEHLNNKNEYYPD